MYPGTPEAPLQTPGALTPARLRRAKELNTRYLDGDAVPLTVRWVDNQGSRWGSCTPADRAIRLSRRLEGMPAWVIDYVLVHELAHLIEAGHTPAFWAWVDRYPKAERAKGFLEGVACATQLGLQAQPPDCSEEGAAAMLASAPSDVERLGGS